MITNLLAFALITPQESGIEGNEGHWPSFRGSHARGIAEGFPLPSQWNVAEEKNVLWKKEIPGLAHSSPVIFGEHLYLTSAGTEGDPKLKLGLYGDGTSVEQEGEHSFLVLCLDRDSGEILWEEEAIACVPKVKRHPKATHVNSTPAVDGAHVVAFFASEGLYCYDTDGSLLWKKDLGVLDAGAPGMRDLQWGFASSPVIHEGRVIVQCDVQDQSFVAAFDVNDGKEFWRTLRDEGPTWSTPTVHFGAGRRQIVLNGYKHIGGYDFDTGTELWRVAGGGDVPVPTPVVAGDVIFITNAHGRLAPIYAIDDKAEGAIDDPEKGPFMRWYHPRRGIYMQTPLVYGEHLYCCSDNGVLGCYEAASGKEMYRERLGDGTSGFSASAVAGDGKLYFTSEAGDVHVVAAGPTFKLLAKNPMGETCMATPALSRGTLYVRTRSHLFAIHE